MATVDLDFIRQDKTRTCTIIGTLGTFEWNLLTERILQKSAVSSEEIFQSDQDSISSTYTSEWQDLLNAINMDTEPTNTLEKAIKTMEVILACEEAHQQGSKVSLTSQIGEPNG